MIYIIHSTQRELPNCLLAGLCALAIGVVLDIIRYYRLQSYGASNFTRLGVLVFTLLMGFYLFREQTRALKLKQKENALFISEITTAFARVIDMKDSYTNGHSARVAKYTAMLARELGCDEETVEKYYRIAQLHDVGKIGIPKSVLNKPGKLTDEEYDIIKSHTVKGYDVLKEVNERIIYAAVSGFGCYGRYSYRPGYDIIAQSYGGLMSITGEEGGHPLRVGNAMGDVLGGMNLTIGILTALHARSLSGKGQRVDVALVDSVVSALETGTQRYFASGKQPELMGNRYAAAYPYDAFPASDGRFVIGCANDKLFRLLCGVLGREDLPEDPRFDTNAKRCENYKELAPEIEAWSRQHTVDECVSLIEAAGVPVSPINDLPRVTTDPHIVDDREMFVPIDHPEIGPMKVNGNPVKLMETMPEISRPAPQLGQDNVEIYGSLLGLSEEKINSLRSAGVL